MSSSCATQLQTVLNRAMGWRRRELVASYLGIPSDDWAARVYCRQAVLLLYSHVEGFVKFASTQYLEAIGASGVASSKLSPALLGLCINRAVNRAINQSSMAIVGELIHKTIEDPDSLPSLPTKNVIRTHSNLSAKRLRAILSDIGLNKAQFGSIESTVIDRLLKWRNAIAHGEGIPIDEADYRVMHHAVLDFLDEFKSYLETCAGSDSYLR